jgi:L-lysine 2,3-aminomutase
MKFASVTKNSNPARGSTLVVSQLNPSWLCLEQALGVPFPSDKEIWHINGLCLSENPEVLSSAVCDFLSRYPGQIIVHTFFQHPAQCSLEAFDACAQVANAGLIISNATDLQEGFNTSSEVIKDLNHKLLMMRVRPYTMNVRASEKSLIAVGIRLMDELRGWTSGLAVPHFIIHEENGNQRVLVPEYIVSHENHTYIFRNYRKDEYEYREQ